jgi:hypothetical protein
MIYLILLCNGYTLPEYTAMKKLALVIILINICPVAYNQIVKGFVLEHKSKEPIPFASVYFNGTFAGTHTDQNGHFVLDVSKYRSMPLSVSALGYYTVTLTDFTKNDPLIINLVAKVFELNEVTIKDKGLARARARNLRVFKNEFLGTTINAMHCIIMNEKDIRFDYGSDDDTLKAYSSEPLVVENLALGYRITYFLDEFELNRRTGNLFFAGNIFFEEELTAKESEKQLYERKRRNAYRGSRMQFFRALWSDSLESEGFTIKDSAERILGYHDVVYQQDSLTKFLNYPGKLVIYYQTINPAGVITPREEKILFDRNGYFNPFGISWEGQIAKQRIGDWLPYEYELKRE